MTYGHLHADCLYTRISSGPTLGIEYGKLLPFLATVCIKRFALYLSVCLSVLSCPICDVGVLWPNSWTDQDETWHASRPRPWPHCVIWGMGTQLASPKGTASQFSVHICSGQMARWIKMPLGRNVVLNPSDIVLDRDPAPPPQKGGSEPNPPIFDPCLLWPNGCMDEDASWYAGRPQPRPHCAR